MCVRYKVFQSENLNRRPCRESLSWNEDLCKMKKLSKSILDKFNCTVPWMLSHSRVAGFTQATICNSSLSANASSYYMERRYDNYKECNNPCMKMKIWMEKKFQGPGNLTNIFIDNDVDLFKEHRLDSILSLGKYS